MNIQSQTNKKTIQNAPNPLYTKLSKLGLLLTAILTMPAALAAPEDDFILTVKTDNTNAGTTSDTQFAIPIRDIDSAGVNYTLDCDDTGPLAPVTVTTDYFVCNYPSAGTYTVRISPQADGSGMPWLAAGAIDAMFDDESKILSVEQWGTAQWRSMNSAFLGAFNLTFGAGIETTGPDLSNVTDMSRMFQNATNFNEPIGDWDVSNVTDMSRMFLGARSFNQPIGDWDVSNVTDMYRMFRSAWAFNQPIGNWDVGNVTNMSEMFILTRNFNQPIGDWDVSNVTNMQQMFFSNPVFNQPIGDWDVGNVTNMSEMFRSAINFNQPIGDWDVSNVTDMRNMLFSASAFDQDISQWNVENVTFFGFFLAGAELSTGNYDALLTAWDDILDVNDGLGFAAGSSQFCAAEANRDNLMTIDGWNIRDAGRDPACDSLDSDGDGALDLDEGNDDRDGDGIINSIDYDPTGYFYDEATGEIIAGGSVAISCDVGTPSFVSSRDGSSGFYQFVVTGVGSPSTCTITPSYPAGYAPSPTCSESAALTAPAGPAPFSLGANENGSTGILTDSACASNPYHLTISFDANSAFVFNNNIPLMRSNNTQAIPATQLWSLLLLMASLGLIVAVGKQRQKV